MSDIKAQIEFLKTIEKVTEEFDAAYLVRKEDSVRWEAAKQAFQEQRSFWRSVHQTNAPDGTADTVTAEIVSGDAKTHKKESN